MIEIRVAKTIGSFAVDAEFAAPDRGVTALFGRSGSGKTTIVNLIAGIVKPDAGRISIGSRVYFDSAHGIDVPVERRRLGYVFQDSRLFPHLTVRSNLRYGLDRSPASEKPIAFDQVVDVLGVRGILGRRPHGLSGGERQRVALGRALLAQPQLLLMDEPLAALDAPRKAEILPYIERLRDEFDTPIVYVSHSLDEVIRLADTLVVVSDGAIAASGDLSEIMSRADLQHLLGRFESGSVLECSVKRHDPHYQLTTLSFADGELLVPMIELEEGARVRARIRARDVSLSRTRADETSISNRLPGVIAGLLARDGPYLDVTVSLGTTSVRALITGDSWERLRLQVGQPIWVMVKAVALDSRSVGFARRTRGDHPPASEGA
jgi:molybdate transport system ATP-binding protein